jgi:hypothetical protein
MGKRGKKPQKGDWLFLSIVCSVMTGALMWALRGAGFGIITFLLTAGICWLSYSLKQ